MKKNILNKLFNSKWNYAWGNVDKHLIALFYEKGGFEGLLKYAVNEKERMDKGNTIGGFDNYYSSDLIETLESAVKELKTKDFEDYILTHYLNFNAHNFVKLRDLGMLEHFRDFNGSFRGDIIKLHEISDIKIIETNIKDEGTKYNIIGNPSLVFSEIEHAFLYGIYKGKYQDTLIILLESAKNN